MSVQFFQDSKICSLEELQKLVIPLIEYCNSFGFELKELTYVFCSDDELLAMNKEHLGHDYYTDILSFDLSEAQGVLEAECYISVDRVLENSVEHKVGAKHELARVMVHGLLHFVGLSDSTDQGRIEMRAAEDKFLNEYCSTWNKN